MSIKVYPYKMASASSKALALNLSEDIGNRVFRIKLNNSNYYGKPGDLVVNWGNSTARSYHPDVHVMNKAGAIAAASHKRSALVVMKERGVSVPEFHTDSIAACQALVANEDLVLYGRELMNSSSGKGIKIIRSGDDVGDLRLYVEGIQISHEYRIHVMTDYEGCFTVIDAIKKRRRTGEPANEEQKLIRSHDNGWIFARNNADGSKITISPLAQVQAIKAVKALGLDFGAVDVILSSDGTAYVLEVNTAPGLTGKSSCQAYTDGILKFYKQMHEA